MAEPGLVVLPGPYGGHPGSVFTVGYSPDGKLLASGGWDGTVRLWNPRAGGESSVLAGHAGPVRSVAFAPGLTLLASGGRDRTIRLWDTAARTSAGVLRGHEGAVLSVAFAAGRPLLASVGDDGTVRLWNPLDGTQLDELPDDARAIAFSPDGHTLATAGRDGKIRLWNHGDRTHTTIAGHTGPVLSVAFAAGRPLLASVGDDGTVRLWNPLDGTQLDELPDDARAIAFSPDGHTLATAGRDVGILLWDLTDRPHSTPLERTRRSHDLAFDPDGTHVADAGDAGDVCVYDLAGHADPTQLVGHTCEILSVACSPDGALLATGDVDGAIRIWDTTDGSLVRRLVADREWVRSLAFGGTSTLLAAAIGGRIRVWEVTSGLAPVTTLDPGRGLVTSVAFFPASSGPYLLVSADEGGQLAIWNASDGTLAATSPPMGHPIVSVAVDPREATLIGAGDDGVIRQWDPSLVIRRVFTPAIHRARCVALRPDGRLLAGAGGDGVIRLWNVADSAMPVTTLPGHVGVVRALAFSPDGTLLASAGDDGAIRLWDARDGSAIRILIDRTGVVRSVAFAPDSATLVSIGDDGRINGWNVHSGVPTGRGRRQARPLQAVPGIRSDEPSRVDLLGLDDDVEMLATLITAASTAPPLAVALLGEWGAGKSSVMLQVEDAVERLAARTRTDPGDSAYVSNVCQVRFNAWHYSDDQVWTGLIDHLFRKLAVAADDGRTPPNPDDIRAERDRLHQEVRDQQQCCAELDSQRGQMSRGLAAMSRMAWRNRLPLLLRGLLTAVAFVFIAFKLLSGGLITALVTAWNLARGQQVTDWLANGLAEEARQARERLAALQDQLAQVDAAVRLARLLNRQSDLDPYGAGRGLLGQVHRDLEQLSTDLDRLRKEHQLAGQAVPPPLERIILYIDDLDRCPPARVVEVLAAVHLMLALPLFVVIVAVDPRWLLEALYHHYRELFAQSTEETGIFGPGERPATPLDYLDKIFQVPFTVRSLSAGDAGGFLASLLGHDPADADQLAAGPASGPRESAVQRPAGDGRPEHSPPSSLIQPSRSSAPLAPADRPRPAAPGGEAGPGLRPGGLVLRAPEIEFMVQLGPLLSTPRAAKKLVNLYRLVRVGIPEEHLPTFIGLGGYQVVQILLAILVGAPDAAPIIFTAIRAAARDEDVVRVVHGAEPTAGPRIAEFVNGIRDTAPQAVADIRVYQQWCPTLARFSFYTRSFVGS